MPVGGSCQLEVVVRVGGGFFGAVDYLASHADSRHHLPVDQVTDTIFNSEHRTCDGCLCAAAAAQRV